MNDSGHIRPLHMHTLESLCADLTSGLSVEVGENGVSFKLQSDASRGVLAWYARNKSKWSANVQTFDVEAIVDAATAIPPIQPNRSNAKVSGTPRRFTLTSLTAHQFAGLHHAGTAAVKPNDFVFEIKHGITLFEGYNGCGKTSLLNSIIWTLTGDVLRPQRPPESANKDFEFEVDNNSIHTVPPVVPLPDPTTEAVTARAIPVDTWVELEFKDQEQQIYRVRRSLKRGSRDVLREEVTGLDELGLDPVSARVGTSMPGILPYVQVGSASALGKAVSELTGMAPLALLALHASKSKKKIDGDLSKTKRNDIHSADDAYMRSRSDLINLILKRNFGVGIDDVPPSSGDSTIEDKLELLSNKLDKLKGEGLSHVKHVLGETFNAQDAAQRSDLIKSIEPALSAVTRLGALPSMARLARLTKLTGAESEPVRAYIAEVRNEAAKLVEIATEPDKAARLRLYTRVAAWIKDHPGLAHDESNCAVCGQTLTDVIDSITGLPVKEHLEEASQEGDFAGKTFNAWARHVLGEFANRLPTSLVSEARLEPPDGPISLIRQALIEELFSDAAFSGSLSPLSEHVGSALDDAFLAFPVFAFAASPEIGSEHQEFKELNQFIYRIERALAFASWRISANDAIASLMQKVVGQSSNEAQPTWPKSLKGQLYKLQTMITAIEPVNEASVKHERMVADIKRRRGFEQRLNAYGNASLALQECIAVGDLAEIQVAQLQKKLHASASHWRNKIYLSAFPATSMELVDSRMSGGGDLQLLVGAPRVSAPAQHVSNASALRASLLAFYLAYWQHMLKERGGIQLLLLDDPQELLDSDNRDRLAEAVYDIFKADAQLILTTHDTRFAMAVAKRTKVTSVPLNHLYVHPATAKRGTIFLTPSIANVQLSFEHFNSDPNDPLAAQTYLSECRIFLEGRMGDFFDDPSYPAATTVNFSPTLADHLNRLRSLVKAAPNELFKSSAITTFVNDPALKEGSPTLALLNKSHHRDRAMIRPKEVYDIKAELDRLRQNVERAHEQFRNFNRREPLLLPENEFVPLISAIVPPFKIPVMASLKAFVRDASYGDSQETELDEISSDWFKLKAFFYVRSDTLGFAGPKGSIAIANVDPAAPSDHQLVIARAGKDTFARRLLRPHKSQFVALSAETPDPRKSPPTRLLPEHEVSLHPIVGMLFGGLLNVPTSKAEAVQILEAPQLLKVCTAYRIKEESAIPLALPGQIALGGAAIPLNELDAHIDDYVALELDDGTNLFKRVGERLPFPLQYLRQFETIGGLGVADVLAIDGEHKGFRMVIRAVSIIGVLYASPT